MKLVKIYYDAYKSLINQELSILHDCIALVGINESGKSNVLAGINVLSGSISLKKGDTPKMRKGIDPQIKYEFRLDDNETNSLLQLVDDWRREFTLYPKKITISEVDIIYTVQFDRSLNSEARTFGMRCRVGVDKDALFLLPDQPVDIHAIKQGMNLLPLSRALVIKEIDLRESAKLESSYDELQKVQASIERLRSEIDGTETTITLLELAQGDSNQNAEEKPASGQETLSNANEQEISSQKAILLQLGDRLNREIATHENLVSLVNGYQLPRLISEVTSRMDDATKEYQALEAESNLLIDKINELKGIGSGEAELKTNVEKLESQKEKTASLSSLIEKEKELLNRLNQQLQFRYTRDLSTLVGYFLRVLRPHLDEMMPKVVFWEHSEKFILPSETPFIELLQKISLDEISRPLVNVLRIGLGIRSIDELREKIKEIQEDGSERSRFQEEVNDKVNAFIESVWKDYDQDLKISLEKDQIRIQVYDPTGKGASYYNMEERSQGCKAFLSFLLTVGAEAERDVIKNTILLLDEPETHLHPSGVRFMLQELIQISQKQNLVIYATHSIFLIDRKKFDRHIILKKTKEHSNLVPSNVGRIGYFMQEELLYGALEFNIGKDFNSSNKFNFVFEGEGDVVLFAHFYDKYLTKDSERPFPIKYTAFHQGGKCSDIQKYLISRPIQLGTKWIFILDKDSAANELARFIKGKYKDYIGKDVFVYQYNKDGGPSGEVELEDMLPIEMIIDCYRESAKYFQIELTVESIKKTIGEGKNFVSYFEPLNVAYIKTNVTDDFKARFKETLNSKIKSICTTDKDGKNFINIFPAYSAWVQLSLQGLSIENYQEQIDQESKAGKQK